MPTRVHFTGGPSILVEEDFGPRPWSVVRSGVSRMGQCPGMTPEQLVSLPLLEIIWESEVMRRLWKTMENAAFLIGDAVAYAAWRSRRRIRVESDRRCDIRGRLMREDEDYGGDCVFCMADIGGEPAAIEHVERLVEKWKARY